MATINLPTQFQQVIHLSKYARWKEEQGRRETWEETVDRYVDYMFDKQCKGKVSPEIREEIRKAILTLEVMPSMRCMQTAGKALDQNQVAGYNCSAAVVDHPYVFDEMLEILMNGCGFGFSVERQFIAKLPSVAEKMRNSNSIIVVEDSKEGWGHSLRELISCLYSGSIPRWDLSKIRPMGARLKIFGGRASGPAPLEALFRFTVETFKGAAGRKLTSIECHDIACRIAECVCSGGVRRSALISLSNPSDDRMRHAKSGDWWVTAPYRMMANNSACWTEKPDAGMFMREWLALYESKSGERGIVNRVALQNQAAKYGMRDPNVDYVVNPCVTEDTWILTDHGPEQVSSLIGKSFGVVVNGEVYECHDGFFYTGEKDVFLVCTDRGYEVKATSNHPVLVERCRKIVYKRNRKIGYERDLEWVEVKKLKVGDKLVLGDHEGFAWGPTGEEEIGWLIGEIVGDGGYNPDKYPAYLRFWGDTAKDMADYAADIISRRLSPNRQFKGEFQNKGMRTWQVGGRVLDQLCSGLISPLSKNILPKLEQTSSSFVRGFIRGFFDADGCVQGNPVKGRSVRLCQSNRSKLVAVQRMLSRIGIVSTITKERRGRGERLMPDGKGGEKLYMCEPYWELIVARNCLDRFADLIGFADPDKSKRLEELCNSITQTAYEDTFTAEVNSVDLLCREKVYDCSIEGIHQFDANGIIVHNCGEVISRPSGGLCNLTEVIIRSEDTIETLKRKVVLATILGTMQASLLNFTYLRDIWRKNAEEEALLGVGLTGIFDNKLMSGEEGKRNLIETLEVLRKQAEEVNAEWAPKIGINKAAAICLVKPSGSVSSLVGSSSGIHPRHAPFYIRRIRLNKSDPLAVFMTHSGFLYEDDVTKPESMWVFSFPIKSPKDAKCGRSFSSLEHMNLWLIYRNHWCHHNPSVTINIEENEWMDTGAWVYENFDSVGGMSFLPRQGHVYPQMPFEEIDEKTYLEMAEKIPDNVDWSKMVEYEKEDCTTSSREQACVNGQCELH